MFHRFSSVTHDFPSFSYHLPTFQPLTMALSCCQLEAPKESSMVVFPTNAAEGEPWEHRKGSPVRWSPSSFELVNEPCNYTVSASYPSELNPNRVMIWVNPIVNIPIGITMKSFIAVTLIWTILIIESLSGIYSTLGSADQNQVTGNQIAGDDRSGCNGYPLLIKHSHGTWAILSRKTI